MRRFRASPTCSPKNNSCISLKHVGKLRLCCGYVGCRCAGPEHPQPAHPERFPRFQDIYFTDIGLNMYFTISGEVRNWQRGCQCAGPEHLPPAHPRRLIRLIRFPDAYTFRMTGKVVQFNYPTGLRENLKPFDRSYTKYNRTIFLGHL